MEVTPLCLPHGGQYPWTSRLFIITLFYFRDHIMREASKQSIVRWVHLFCFDESESDGVRRLAWGGLFE